MNTIKEIFVPILVIALATITTLGYGFSEITELNYISVQNMAAQYGHLTAPNGVNK